MQSTEPTKEDLITIIDDDVRSEPALRLEDVWRTIEEEFTGLDSLIQALCTIQKTVEVSRRDGTAYNPNFNFILQGPPGTGKSTIAEKILGPFFCALDVIPHPNLSEKELTGSGFKAPYEGQTTGHVRSIFQRAFGRTLFVDEISSLGTDLFAKEAIKTMLLYLENYPGRFVFVCADYDYKIKKFLASDDGFSRRFPDSYRITLEPWKPLQCSRVFVRSMKTKYFIDVADHAEMLEQLFESVCSQSCHIGDHTYGFASGGTVKLLVDDTYTSHNNTNPAKGSTIQVETLRQVFQKTAGILKATVDDEIRKDQTQQNLAAGASVRVHAPPVQTRHAGDAQKTVLELQDSDKLTRENCKMFEDVLDRVNQTFADRYNENPELQKKDEADINSDYNRELAQQLQLQTGKQVSPEVAQKVTIRLRVIKKRLIQKIVKQWKGKKIFKYHCPYCDTVDGPHCAYRDYPREWYTQTVALV
jgi:hypothetical protein